MQGATASLFTRASFTMTAAALTKVNYLELNAVYDGGFIAYLNGTEICRVNAPLRINGQSVATTVRGSATEVPTIHRHSGAVGEEVESWQRALGRNGRLALEVFSHHGAEHLRQALDLASTYLDAGQGIQIGTGS